MIAADLASDLRYSADKARTWLERRDAKICAARAAGGSLRAIAAQTGLTHPTIARICRDGQTSEVSR
jgi:phage protein D